MLPPHEPHKNKIKLSHTSCSMQMLSFHEVVNASNHAHTARRPNTHKYTTLETPHTQYPTFTHTRRYSVGACVCAKVKLQRKWRVEVAIDARRKETETMEGEQTMWVSNRAHECHTMQAESRRSTGKTQATFVCARWVLSACVSVRANCRPPSERFMKSMQAQSSQQRGRQTHTHRERR